MRSRQRPIRSAGTVRRALGRHWRLAAGVAAVVLVLTFSAIARLPRVYVSEALLAVQAATPAEELDVDAFATDLAGPLALERLVDSLGPDYVLGSTSQPLPQPPAPQAVAGDNQPSPMHQQAVHALQQIVAVRSLQNRNLISVQCRAGSPQRAQEIAARLVEICLPQSVGAENFGKSNQPVSEHNQLLAEQARLAKQEWERAAARLKSAQATLGADTLSGQEQQIQEELAGFQNQLSAKRSQVSAAEARIAALQKQNDQKQIGGEPIEGSLSPVTSPDSPSRDEASDDPQAVLAQLEALEQQLAATRSDGHPQLAAVREQIAALRGAAAQPAAQPAANPMAPPVENPPLRSRQALDSEWLAAKSKLEALRSQERLLIAQHAKLQGDLDELSRQEAALAPLRREVELAEARHKSHADQLDQARDAIPPNDQRIARLSVVRPASLPTRSSGPQPMHVLALGVAISLISGCGSALFAARLAPVLASEADLERLWDVPLVAVLPPLQKRQSALG
jgi:uncharacterized protein involved in exopolysaccharide biosynthesis